MSDNILPQTKPPKLVVVVAFDRGEDGELFPAFGPADRQSVDRPAGRPGWLTPDERLFPWRIESLWS